MTQTITNSASIVVAGAGSIGCYLGGVLLYAGKSVTLLARQRIHDELMEHGLHLTDFAGCDETLAPAQLRIATDPVVLSEADIILVTVKSAATAEMASLIDEYAAPGAIVVSFQNGVNNADVLRKGVGGRRVLAGMVPFNVVSLGDGHFHQGTSGELVIEAGPGHIQKQLSTEKLPVLESEDIKSVMWGKLLLNLNNALNALSGLPLKQQLESRSWRCLIADQMAEALSVLDAARIKPARAIPLPPKLLPHLMRLPTPIYRLIAGKMLKIDPNARSSMWEDLKMGRKTEIAELQGACVDLGRSVGVSTPICERVMSLIREAEEAGAGSPGLSVDVLRDRIHPGLHSS